MEQSMEGKEKFIWQVPSCLPFLTDQAHTTRATLPHLPDCVSQPPQGHRGPPRSSVCCFIQDREAAGVSPSQGVWFTFSRGSGHCEVLAPGEAAGCLQRQGKGTVGPGEAHGVWRLQEGMFHTRMWRMMRLLKKSSTSARLKATGGELALMNHSQLGIYISYFTAVLWG